MKTYSIGRDESCNIIIADSTNMVSRYHATLNVEGNKITIIDESTNGTFINGIKIASGTPVPVTRKDVISFAQVTNLDWSLIPNLGRKRLIFIIFSAIAILLLGGGIYYCYNKQNKERMKADLIYKETLKNDSIKWNNIGIEISDIEKRIASIVDKYKLESDSVSILESVISKKTTGKDLNTVIEILGQIKSEINSINITDINNLIIRIKDNYKDHSGETEERLSALKQTVGLYEKSINKVSDLLKDANKRLSKIKNRSQLTKTEPEKQEEKTTGIQSPNVIF